MRAYVVVVGGGWSLQQRSYYYHTKYAISKERATCAQMPHSSVQKYKYVCVCMCVFTMRLPCSEKRVGRTSSL